MSGYVKIYESILDSSVWAEPAPTRCVWLAMLAMCDADGKVEASPSGLARRANVSMAECRTATEALEGPDLESKSPEWGGRRIEKVEGGWLILNYKKYRELRSPRQIQTADRQARFRARQDEEKESVPERDAALRNGDKRIAVAVAVDEAVPATAKEEERRARPGVAALVSFLLAFDFGRWHDVVSGYIKANRRPINVIKHLELHLTGEMGYKKREPTDVGFALNQYAASGQQEFLPVLFDGFVRRVKTQKDRNEAHGQNANEDMRIVQERREREEREQDDRDNALLVDFERTNEAKYAELMARAESSIDARIKGEGRTLAVRTALIRLVRKAT